MQLFNKFLFQFYCMVSLVLHFLSISYLMRANRLLKAHKFKNERESKLIAFLKQFFKKQNFGQTFSVAICIDRTSKTISDNHKNKS